MYTTYVQKAMHTYFLSSYYITLALIVIFDFETINKSYCRQDGFLKDAVPLCISQVGIQDVLLMGART